jgi:hypothetical protein
VGAQVELGRRARGSLIGVSPGGVTLTLFLR